MFIGIGKQPREIGEKAPDFTLPSSCGKSVSLGEFRGKKVFLFFFRGTWCPQCSTHMKKINHELSDLKLAGIEILGICCQSLEPLQVFLKKTGIGFPILSDENRAVAKSYGVYTYLSWDSVNIARPSFFYIDEEGIIRYRYIGEHQWDRPDMNQIKALADFPGKIQ